MLSGLLCVSFGCSKAETPFSKSTIKVTGVITINGDPPEESIQLESVPDSGRDAEHPTVSTAETKEDGSFEFTTYQTGDGVPPGNYSITAKCVPFNMMTRERAGGDKLGGQYDEVKESPKKFEAEEGESTIDLGTIDLQVTLKKK